MSPEAAKAYGSRYGTPAKTEPSIYGQQNERYRYAPPKTPIGYSGLDFGQVSVSPERLYNKPYAELEPDIQYAQQMQAQMPKPQAPVAPLPINRAQIKSEPIGSESTLNLSRSALSEQQLPVGEQALDINYLQTVGMTPPQAQYFIDTLQTEALTPQQAAQFRYVFNIQPGSDFDAKITNATFGAPLSNDEMMGNIYDELWNVPAGYQPLEQIISGGSSGGNAPTIGTGAGVTWGGY
jgi:hypothetical protein